MATILVHGALVILAAFSGTTETNLFPQVEETYCQRAVPVLIKVWEKKERPENLLMQYDHNNSFVLLRIQKSHDTASLRMQGNFNGEFNDTNADGVLDKGIGGDGISYDSSSKSDALTKAQRAYENKCKEIWPILEPLTEQAG